MSVASGSSPVKGHGQHGDWLPTTGYVVLGLLSFGQRLTGYEVRQWALGSTRFFWSAPAMSQIYRELERLERADLVDRRDESGDAERARTTYGLTDAGLAELRRWIDDAPPEEPVVRHPAAFRLFLGHLADPDKLRDRLTAHRDWLDQLLADLDDVRDGLAGDERFAYPAMVADWGVEFFGAERSATDGVITRIDGSAQETPSIRSSATHAATDPAPR